MEPKNISEYIPELIGVSADQKHLDMILHEPDEITAWYRLMRPSTPRVCSECGATIDGMDMFLPRVEVPINPDAEPIAMTECQAVCPYCKKIIHIEYAEFGYPFISAQFVQKSILRNLRQKKAGDVNGEG